MVQLKEGEERADKSAFPALIVGQYVKPARGSAGLPLVFVAGRLVWLVGCTGPLTAMQAAEELKGGRKGQPKAPPAP